MPCKDSVLSGLYSLKPRAQEPCTSFTPRCDSLIPHCARTLFFSTKVKIALAQALLSSSRWLSFDEGASPSFRPRLLGPRPSSEVETKDGPADTRPLRNIIQGAARARGLPAMLPALPCAFLSKRTRARIATLFSSMPPARLTPFLRRGSCILQEART